MKTRPLLPIDLYNVRQRFEAPRIDDPEAHLTRELEKLSGRLSSGSTVALAVGSRGISAIDRIVRAACGWLKRKKAKPFIVPAMGSHGGATAEGQTEILRSYGVTEEAVGAPIRSSMEVVQLSSDLSVKLFIDARA